MNKLLSLLIFIVQVSSNYKEVQECNIKINQLSSKLKQQDISYLREELKRLLTERSIIRTTLKEIVDKLVL